MRLRALAVPAATVACLIVGSASGPGTPSDKDAPRVARKGASHSGHDWTDALRRD